MSKEAEYVFEDFKKNTEISFDNLLILYRKKTNKHGLSTFYGFLREMQLFNVLEEIPRYGKKEPKKYLLNFEKLKAIT
jgi:hypothetical protein